MRLFNQYNLLNKKVNLCEKNQYLVLVLTNSYFQVFISSTFYTRIFCMKVLCAAFLQLHYGFVIFGHNNIGTKGASKMEMKLTPDVASLSRKNLKVFSSKRSAIKRQNVPISYLGFVLNARPGVGTVRPTGLTLAMPELQYNLRSKLR